MSCHDSTTWQYTMPTYVVIISFILFFIIIITVFFSPNIIKTQQKHSSGREKIKPRFKKSRTMCENETERGREESWLACKHSGISLLVFTAEERVPCICACIHKHTHKHTPYKMHSPGPAQRAVKVVRPERRTVSRPSVWAIKCVKACRRCLLNTFTLLWTIFHSVYSIVFVHFNKLHA